MEKKEKKDNKKKRKREKKSSDDDLCGLGRLLWFSLIFRFAQLCVKMFENEFSKTTS